MQHLFPGNLFRITGKNVREQVHVPPPSSIPGHFFVVRLSEAIFQILARTKFPK